MTGHARSFSLFVMSFSFCMLYMLVIRDASHLASRFSGAKPSHPLFNASTLLPVIASKKAKY